MAMQDIISEMLNEQIEIMADTGNAVKEGIYITVDPETRQITIPEEYSILGVESDEKTERLWFQFPKVVGDNIDLTTLQLRVNYQNANNEADQYIIDDVEAQGDNIVFSWLLRRKVTKYQGVVRFIVCAVKVESGPGVTITNEWNTTLAQATVLEGLEIGDVQPEQSEMDVIAQLIELVTSASEQANQALNTATTAASQAVQAVQNANQAVADANEAISNLNEQIASLNTNFATLANNVSVSQLDTTAKTLVGAIDELNSKMPVSAYQYGVEIPQNSDLDTYKTPGKYVSRGSSVSSTLENSPFTDRGFRLEVRSMIDPGNAVSIQQIAYPGDMLTYKQFAMRGFLNSVWTNWLYFSDDATLSSKLIGNNAGGHNSIFRGKNLGTQVTNEQYAAIQAGTFDDLYIGDYWVIGGVNWRIAAFDYYLNCGDTSFAKHHAVIVPDTSLYSHNMNDTNTTTGGYVGSKMYTEGLEQAKTQIQNAFGASHVLTHRLLLTNATTNGYASGGEWIDSIVDLMCETMVYGSMIISSMNNGTNVPYNYRIEKGQLPLFQMAPQYTFDRSRAYWLRDVVSSAYFARVANSGTASYYGASNVLGVRPAFCIGI